MIPLPISPRAFKYGIVGLIITTFLGYFVMGSTWFIILQFFVPFIAGYIAGFRGWFTLAILWVITVGVGIILYPLTLIPWIGMVVRFLVYFIAGLVADKFGL